MRPYSKQQCRSKSLTFNNCQTRLIQPSQSTQRSIPKLRIYRDSQTNIMGNIIYKVTNVNGQVAIQSNLDVFGTVSASNGNFVNEITAINANLLGDVISTNATVTNCLKVDGMATSFDAHIIRELHVGGAIATPNLNTNNLDVCGRTRTDRLETHLIGSVTDLNLAAGLNHSIVVPNAKSIVDISNSPIITVAAIKSAKVFVLDHNVIIETDPTCDGIEIVIYNRNISGEIVVRNATCIISKVEAQTSYRMIFVEILNKWIKL